MRKILLGLVMGGLAQGAYASDAPVVEEQVYEPAPYVEPAPAFKWQGFYAGLHSGFIRGKSGLSAKQAGVTKEIAKFKKSSFMVGGQVGYNIVNGNFLYGIEGDLSYSRLKAEEKCNSICADASATYSVNYLGTLRPRVGYIFNDRYLLYGTGGLSFANSRLKLAGVASGVPVSYKKSKRSFGWNVGAGLGAMVTQNVSVKAEYLYHRLGGITLVGSKVLGAGNSIKSDKSQLHTVKVGLNYHF